MLTIIDMRNPRIHEAPRTFRLSHAAIAAAALSALLAAAACGDDDNNTAAPSDGDAGLAGSAGTGGDAGSAGSAGTGGDAGSAGSAGAGGDAGSAGSAGVGGDAGSAGSAGSATPPPSPVAPLQKLLVHLDFTAPGWEKGTLNGKPTLFDPQGKPRFNIQPQNTEVVSGVGMKLTAPGGTKSDANTHSSFHTRYDHWTVSPPFYCEVVMNHPLKSSSNGTAWWFYSTDRKVMANGRQVMYEPDTFEHGGKSSNTGGDGLQGPWHRTHNAFHLHVGVPGEKGGHGAGDVTQMSYGGGIELPFVGDEIYTAWGEAIYKDSKGDIIRERHVLDAETRQPLPARKDGESVSSFYRANLSDLARTTWEWNWKLPELDPQALDRTPLQALEFGYNDRLGVLLWVKNDKDFFLASGPNGAGFTVTVKTITCYTK